MGAASRLAVAARAPAAFNRDAFVVDTGIESTVDLDACRSDSVLDEDDLGDDSADAA